MPTNVEVTDYEQRVIAAGDSLSAGVLAAHDTLVTNGKANGWWSHLLDCGTFSGSLLAGALVKLKRYAAISWNLTNNNLIAGDYAVASGVKGGTGKTLDTLFNYQTYGTAILGHSVFLNGHVTNTTGMSVIGRSNGNGEPYMQMYPPTGNVNGLSPAIYQAAGAGAGVWHYSQSTLSLQKNRLNGVTFNTYTNTVPDTTINTTCKLLGPDIPCTQYLSWYAIDDGQMTDAEALAMSDDLHTFLASTGRFAPVAERLNVTFVNGQSLTGAFAPRLSTTQPYENLTFSSNYPGSLAGNVGLFRQNFCKVTSVASGEDPLCGIVNQASALWRVDHPDDDSMDLAITNHGVGGAGIAYITKGGTLGYAESILSIEDFVRLAPRHKSAGVVCRAFHLIHGETDYTRATIKADWLAHRNWFDADIRAITGQAEPVVMILSQPSNAWSYYVTTAISPLTAIQLHREYPGLIVCCCGKYHFTYSDFIHLDGAGTLLLGEYHGKAQDAINRGETFNPLMFASVTKSGRYLTASFLGRIGALVWDTDGPVTDPGDYGLELNQVGGTPVTMQDFQIINGGAEVGITLSDDPGDDAVLRLRSAYTGILGQPGGPTTGPRCNLRDSDPMIGQRSGLPLFNWLVTDEMLVMPTLPPGLEYTARDNALEFTARDNALEYTARG